MDGRPSLRHGPRTAASPAQVTTSSQGHDGSGPATHDPEPARRITQGARDPAGGRELLIKTGVTLYVGERDGRKPSEEGNSEEGK